MSLLVEVVISDFEAIEGLVEETRSWAGQLERYDPPRYSSGNLVLESLPVAKHLRQQLPNELQDVSRCLRIPETAVIGWRYALWNDTERLSIEQFCQVLAATKTPWAIVIDTSNLGEVRVEPAAEALCEQILSAIQAPNGTTLVAHLPK